MPKAPRAGVLAGPYWPFAVLSLTAVAVGCLVARAGGAPAGEWARNLVAWGVGAIFAAGLSTRIGARAPPVVLAMAPLAIAATLFSGGQSGVHRWVQLGPLRMNVAEVLLPAAVVACAVLLTGRRPLWWLAAALTLVLLAAQPDASQATAFGGALVVVIAALPWSRPWRAGGVALVGLAVALSWARPDPLAPVPDVEGVMALAWRLSPFAAILAGAALGGAGLAPLMAARTEGQGARTAAIALTAYAALSVLAPLMGAFPVPLVGMGMSPILGLWLGVGLLAGVKGRQP
jgi:hypothetical protein